MPKNVLPDAARVLPKAGQAIWLKAFNEALDQGHEESEASKMAWAAVKRAGYERKDGKKWGKSMETDFVLNEDGSFVFSAPLMKVDIQKRIVKGFATLDNVDEAGDRVKMDASEEAFSKWFGNIREMHQKIAVGKAIDWKPDTFYDEETGKTYNGIWVEAKISKGAEDTWQKVLDGTLSGFSIGGATLEKERDLVKDENGSVRSVWNITKYRLTELSLVDSPCNRLATISLVKSVDGGVEVDDTIADGDIEKAYDGETGDFVDLSADYEGVVRALETLRDSAIRNNADYVAADASRVLADFRSQCRWECKDAEMQANMSKSEDNKEEAVTDQIEKSEEVVSEETLQNKENSDTSGTVELTDEEKSIFRKFLDFVKGNETPANSGGEVQSEMEETEVNAEEVAKAIDEAGENLTKSVDEKFGQLGESLVKFEEILKGLATAEAVDEIKKGLEAQVEELKTELEAVKNSGAVKKSGDDAGVTGETIEKSDDGLWSGSILPEFLVK